MCSLCVNRVMPVLIRYLPKTFHDQVISWSTTDEALSRLNMYPMFVLLAALSEKQYMCSIANYEIHSTTLDMRYTKITCHL